MLLNSCDCAWLIQAPGPYLRKFMYNMQQEAKFKKQLKAAKIVCSQQGRLDTET